MCAQDLTWDDVDPRRHSFDSSSVLAVISQVAHDEDDVRWFSAICKAIEDRFGAWAAGWSWGRIDGGPVAETWCCVSHSVTSVAETLPRVVDALCE
ncbi:hypothetical protein [Allokutzneria sp. NRRL B-24872]|uniref:hypothetical protein n=1 Tax=Allokutzneria sp. NRRL B-24872 TaxID=1137961 RepID=UPI000A3B642F|nr:hypothetical protein [Allokutzneria sp. NRRL B-24872]